MMASTKLAVGVITSRFGRRRCFCRNCFTEADKIALELGNAAFEFGVFLLEESDGVNKILDDGGMLNEIIRFK